MSKLGKPNHSGINSQVAGTIKQLIGIGTSANHNANFRRILPSKMKELVELGYFIPDSEGSYKIGPAGKLMLKDLKP